MKYQSIYRKYHAIEESRIYNHIMICQSMLTEGYHTLYVYDDLIEDVIKKVLKHISDENFEKFYTGWFINAKYHKPFKSDTYNKCKWIFPVFVEFDNMGYSMFAAVPPKTETKDHVIIVFNINKVNQFNHNKIYNILNHEFVHVHQSFAFEDKDILDLYKNISSGYAPELEVSDDIYYSEENEYDKRNDLFSERLRKVMQYDKDYVYAYANLMYISSDAEQEARISAIRQYVMSLDFMQLNKIYKDYALKHSIYFGGENPSENFSAYEKIDAIIVDKNVSDDYSYVKAYNDELYKIGKPLEDITERKNSPDFQRAINRMELKKIICLAFVLYRYGLFKTNPIVINETVFENMFNKPYLEDYTNDEIETLWSVYEYFYNRYKRYLYKIYRAVWKALDDMHQL